VRSPRERGIDVSIRLRIVRGDIARHVAVHEVPGRARGLDADHGGHRFVCDGNTLGSVLGEVAVAGDDHRDRFPDVIDLLASQWVRGAAVGQRRVGDEQRQRLGERSGQVVVGVDRGDPVDVEGAGDVDVDDAGVRVRRAHHRRGQRVVAQVVQERPAAGEQPAVLAAVHRFAEHPGHEASSAARRTAARMFW
jgi:hypothetical protein